MLILFDLLLFTSEHGCNPRKYFRDDDSFLFRFEFMFLMLLITLGFFGVIVPPILHVFLKSSSIRNTIACIRYFMAEMLILSIPICNIIISLFKLCEKFRESPRNEFEQLLMDEQGFTIFKEFTMKEWSIENIFCYEDILDFHSSDHSEMKSKAIEILQNYVEENSPLEVCISSKIRNITIQKVRNFDKEDPNKIFSELNFEILSNLENTFGRCKLTSKYQKWKKKKRNKFINPLEMNSSKNDLESSLKSSTSEVENSFTEDSGKNSPEMEKASTMEIEIQVNVN
jgi:hypothetical protein